MNILHLGYPKAASTSLQFHLFSRCKGHLYISRVTNGASPEAEAVYMLASRAAQTGKGIKEARAALAEFTQGKPFVFSDERQLFPANKLPAPLERVGSLHDMFGPARCMIMLRRPEDQIRSLYQHWNMWRLRRDKLETETDINTWLGNDIETSAARPSDFSSALHFGEIVRRLTKTFGTENVIVTFLDDFKGMPRSAFADLAQRLGIDWDAPEKMDAANESSENKWVSAVKKHPRFDPQLDTSHRDMIRRITAKNARILEKSLGCKVPDAWLA